MIDLDALTSTPLRTQPFEWALVEQAIPAAGAGRLLTEFPTDDFWVISDDDGEKSYTYAARPLVTLGADRAAALSPLSAAWQELAEDLVSGEYRAALSELIGRSLDDALMEASTWRWDAGMQLGPHLDMASKIVTQVFYLSSEWDVSWGGCLRILGSRDPGDIVAELPPMNGSASVLVRSEKSWHSVAPVASDALEPRRSVIVTWFMPGSTSPVWGVRDGGAISCVARGSVRERARTVSRTRRVDAPRRDSVEREAPSATGAHSRSSTGALTAAEGEVTTQVAMVGTFDVPNFGDLLLPLIAARQLRARLGPGVQMTLYSYRSMEGASWPFETVNLARLPHEVAKFDLVLIGGGQIVRLDPNFPPGYLPSDPSVHHPLGLWLTPALLAAAAGVPVAWNAPGVSDGIPSWLDPLIQAAVHGSAHVAVRDQLSARLLTPHAPGCAIEVVPDTGFGVRSLLPDEPSDAFRRLVAALGLGDGYVVLQPTADLLPVREGLLRVIDAARERGLRVLELPMGPVHGDEPGLLGALGDTVTPEMWPEPELLAELLAGADAVLAQSFHAGVVAVATGVPLFRPKSPAGWKYEALESCPGVYALASEDRELPAGATFGRRRLLADADERSAQLAHHWDAVAAAARRGDNGASAPRPAFAASLPAIVSAIAEHGVAAAADRAAAEARNVQAAAEIASLRSDLATLLAQKDEFTARADQHARELTDAAERIAALDAVRNRKIVRLALGLARLVQRQSSR